MIKKLWNRRLVYWKRNQIILNDLNRSATPNQVNLHWYSCGRKDGLENFGDFLSLPVFHYMIQQMGIDEHKRLSRTKHLYAIGSILFWGRQDAVIWGSGLLNYPPEGTYRSRKFHLDIRAVRGPVTREILMKEGFDCPEIYGDPAIIMPLVYKPKCEKNYEFNIIKHKANFSGGGENEISILCNDYRTIIDQIASSNLIISSSLHGIIIAEAYGVPAVMLHDSRPDFNLLKYNDYYFSTGRYNYPIAKSIEEALEITPAPLPDLENMRKKLMRAFPADLWE